MESDFLTAGDPWPIGRCDSNAMIKSCLSLLAGAYALHFTSFTSANVVFPLAVFGAAIAWLAGGRRASAWFVIGLSLFWLHAQRAVDLRMAAQYEGDSMMTVLQVVDFPRRSGDSITFTARPIDDPRIPRTLRIGWYDTAEEPQIGDVWQFEVRLRRPRGTSNPGLFDYEAWLFRQRIGATGYVVNGPRNQRLVPLAGGPSSRLRRRVVARLEALIGDSDTAAVLAAISVGARHGISPEQWLRFSQSGTSHLMAISGLHVGLAASSAWLVAVAVSALLRVRGNHLKIGWVAAIVVAAAYAGLSGFAVPARRATLMLLLLVLAFLHSREPRPAAILASACLVVTVIDPLATLAPGYQLSFAAVLLLLWFGRRRAFVTRRSITARLPAAAVQLAAVQVFLLFGLMPLTVANFGRVSFVAPAVNFVAVPLFSIVTVPFTLAGLLLGGPAAAAGDAALRFAGASIEALLWLIDRSLSVPFAAASTSAAGVAAVLCTVSLLGWAVLPRAWPGRHIAVLAALVLVSGRVGSPPDGCADVRMLDVAQGLAIVVRTRQRTLLYDTGAAFRGGGDMASRVVLPYLAAQGIRRIDRLVVSHSDIDHAGGVRRVLAGLEVAEVLAGEPSALAGVGADTCRRGLSWRWDGVEFRVLHPPQDGGYTDNDASCVIVVAAGNARLLLTGDIESGVERLLVDAEVAGPVHAIMVPHHGSKTSSSTAFVQAASAEVALVSAGYRNRWDLPRPDVVRRWRDAGAAVFVTAEDGAIGFRLCDGRGIAELERNREHARRLWNEPPQR